MALPKLDAGNVRRLLFLALLLSACRHEEPSRPPYIPEEDRPIFSLNQMRGVVESLTTPDPTPTATPIACVPVLGADPKNPRIACCLYSKGGYLNQEEPNAGPVVICSRTWQPCAPYFWDEEDDGPTPTPANRPIPVPEP